MPPDALQQVLHQGPDPLTSPEYQEHIRQLCTILSIPPEHLVANVKSQVPEKKIQDSATPLQRTSVSQVADNQWRASVTIDLGVFPSKEKAEIACKRYVYTINIITSVAATTRMWNMSADRVLLLTDMGLSQTHPTFWNTLRRLKIVKLRRKSL